MAYEIFKSEIDSSVNFVKKIDCKNSIECRFVQRDNTDYAIIYVSSQTGCKMACRMCHLTSTGQNKSRDCTTEELMEQFIIVENYIRDNFPEITDIHVDFMARGEPLDNINVNASLFTTMRSVNTRLDIKVLISTIMPISFNGSLYDRLGEDVNIYYSIYSCDEKFRKKWLPRAMPYEEALYKLHEWQAKSNRIPKIHYALIEGQNDSKEDARNIVDALQKYKIHANFNIVRYNPFSDKYGEESKYVTSYANYLRSIAKFSSVKVKNRVGFDVKASCGMFF